jgi:hypothetical protein
MHEAESPINERSQTHSSRRRYELGGVTPRLPASIRAVASFFSTSFCYQLSNCHPIRPAPSEPAQNIKHSSDRRRSRGPCTRVALICSVRWCFRPWATPPRCCCRRRSCRARPCVHSRPPVDAMALMSRCEALSSLDEAVFCAAPSCAAALPRFRWLRVPTADYW